MRLSHADTMLVAFLDMLFLSRCVDLYGKGRSCTNQFSCIFGAVWQIREIDCPRLELASKVVT